MDEPAVPETLRQYRLVAHGVAQKAKAPTVLQQKLIRFFEEDFPRFMGELTGLEKDYLRVQARVKTSEAQKDSDKQEQAVRGDGDDRLDDLLLSKEWSAILVRLPKEPTGELDLQAVVAAPGGPEPPAPGAADRTLPA